MNTNLQTENNIKTLGIIGGMGALSTAELFYDIVRFTKADADCAHLPVLIDNDPSVPDRTQAIEQGSNAPAVHISRNIQKLSAQGADIFIVCCNTSHYFYDEILKETGENIINMPFVTAGFISEKGIKKVCVLATTGTIQSGIYTRALEHFGIEALIPGINEQQQIMDIIYKDIKAGKPTDEEAFYKLLEKEKHLLGAQTFLLGCTELSLAAKNMSCRLKEQFRLIDPLVINACHCVTACGKELTCEAKNILKVM